MGSGGRDRIRTCDHLIKSQMLYQLSYAPRMMATIVRPIPMVNLYVLEKNCKSSDRCETERGG